jgi:hypothetical protein
MYFIVFFSKFLSSLFIGYVLSLLTMKLIADILRCIGWQDVLC